MGRPSFKESKTAIVIIAWNSDHFIGACVESALSLRCRTLDVWVVDNGSSDSTPDIFQLLLRTIKGYTLSLLVEISVQRCLVT